MLPTMTLYPPPVAGLPQEKRQQVCTIDNSETVIIFDCLAERSSNE